MTSDPTRRDALTAAAWLAASAAGAGAADPTPAVIDTHTHFYDPTRPGGVPWPGKDDTVLYRRVLPAEYMKLAKPHGVTGTVVVEASPWVEDNQWLLDLAKDEPFVVGVVGRLWPGDEDFAKHLARFAKNPLFRGVRWTETEARYAVNGKTYFERVQALSDAGLTLDLNGTGETFVYAAKLGARLPDLRVVVDHVGNPMIDGKELPEGWRKRLTDAAAAGKNVWCKLSGLKAVPHRTDRKAPTDPAFYRPVLDAVWEAFGADRLLFGSNWPVSDHYATFATVHAVVAEYVKGKGAAAAGKVFGANATAAYRLTRG